MRIPVFGLEGVEADDTIASIITQCASDHAELAIRIASRDKDLTQLCAPRVDMFDAMKDALVTIQTPLPVWMVKSNDLEWLRS